LPEKGYSGVNGILELGCCDPGGDTCIGCELGDCAIRQDECLEIGGIAFSTDQICDLSMNSCTPPPCGSLGCCVISAGNCNEDVTIETCEGEASIAWFLDTDCSEIPQCAPLPKNVPTLSGWSLLSLAVVLGILGIVGFMVIRRRKVAA